MPVKASFVPFTSPVSTLCVFGALALSLGLPGVAHAEKADRDKPMNIEADTLRYDDLKQVSLFTGRVILTKGTIIIRGARLEVREDPDGFQYGTVNAGPDKLAYFRQKREGLDEYMEGEAELIEYDGRADTVKLTRKAIMRRLRGATLADEVTGAVIVYENLNDKFSVDGATPAAGGGRVRAMLTPKPDNRNPRPAVDAIAPPLRATQELREPPK